MQECADDPAHGQFLRFMVSVTPKLFSSFRDYTFAKFTADLIAGITVGLVALPLSLAFAISSGVAPQAGLYTACIAGFLISALGGSKVQIGGPTGAFVVVVFGIVQKYGIEGLIICTVLAGVLLVILGLSGMGSAVKFIPRPVVLGFTNGIAVLIASTQLRDLFGLKIDHVPGAFLPRMIAIAEHIGTISPVAIALGAGTLFVIICCSKFFRRIPGAIAAMVVGTTLVFALHLPVETIGTRFGGIPSGFPRFVPIHVNLDLMTTLAIPALTVAMLGAIESLMSAVVADRMTGDRHNPNAELVAQGIANIVSPLFGGLPATGAIARTATNVRSGAQTPVAGMVHALVVLFVLVFAAKTASFVPLAVLAAILLSVAYNMGEWSEIPLLLHSTRADVCVWGITFALTVFADLTVAVEVGMILAALLYIQRVSNTTTVSRVTPSYVEEARIHTLQDKTIPDYVAIFRIHGPFLFGATDKIEEILSSVGSLPDIVVLRLRNMTAIDATGLAALEDLADKLHASGRVLILCGAREQPAHLMERADFARHVGVANMCHSVQDAIRRSQEIRAENLVTAAA